MRILLILIVIAAVIVVVRAQSRDCKYDGTLINCVLGKSEMPAAETPPRLKHQRLKHRRQRHRPQRHRRSKDCTPQSRMAGPRWERGANQARPIS